MSLLRVASYNIHACIGTDGHYRPDRIRNVLQALGAQVVALQEVESGHGHGELLHYLTADCQWQFIEGPTLQRENGYYGNALLTSVPVQDYRLLDLSVEHREPRGAIDLSLRYRGADLRVIATHLGLRAGERRSQIRKLLDWVGPPNETQYGTTILMGDLNEWFLWGRPLRWLRNWFDDASAAPATFPSRWPMFALDRIWTYPRQQHFKIEAINTRLTRIASDHRPVVATLDTANLTAKKGSTCQTVNISTS